ncbi:hypothetical protein MRX96_036174 [Rhipicephalus microplus]
MAGDDDLRATLNVTVMACLLLLQRRRSRNAPRRYWVHPLWRYRDTEGMKQDSRSPSGISWFTKGVEFEDKRYVFGPEPDFDGEEWLSEKPTLGLRFPNLPYYLDDDVKITQSLAILRYLARKHELAATDEEETLELDMLEQQARDVSWVLLMAVASPSYEETRPKYEEKMESLLQPWDEHLQDKEWAIGDRVTYVDFLLYEGLDWNRELNGGKRELLSAPSVYSRIHVVATSAGRFEKALLESSFVAEMKASFGRPQCVDADIAFFEHGSHNGAVVSVDPTLAVHR